MLMAKEVAQTLASRSYEIASYLFPFGKRQGQEWCVGNLRGDAGNSLKIHLEGEKSGVWCDFATGDSGDLLDLWAQNKQISLSEAIKQASEYLGIGLDRLSGSKPVKFVRPKNTPTQVVSDDSEVMNYLTHERKLTKETIAKYFIHEKNGSIVFPYYRDNELISIKYLRLNRDEKGKKIIYVEKDCEPCLFGWHLISKMARKIIICEGEIDAMSLCQYGLPALSVPFGAGGGKKHEWIEHEYDRLALFDEIIICMDNDEEGQKAAKEIMQRLGLHRCKLMELPFKDPNECLQAHLSKEDMQYLVKQALSIEPVELKESILAKNATINWLNPPNGKPIGYVTPWSKVNDKILFRPYEFSVWTGINGHGKSQLLGQVILSLIDQGAKVCLASLEMRPEIFLGRLIKQAAAMPNPSNEYADAVFNWFGGKLWHIDVLGKISITRLMEVFNYGLKRYGIDVFIIDSFMMLNDIYEDDFRSQKACIEQLCQFKNQNYCQVHLIVHPRKGADEYNIPSKLDAKGTGTITDAADNCFSVWRNKKKEELIDYQKKGHPLTEKEARIVNMPDAFLYCDKQRNGMWEGKVSFWYNKDCFQYLEHENQKPKRYVEYSCLE